MTPQFPTSRGKPRPAAAFSPSFAASKKATLLAAIPPPPKNMARPASAPDLTKLSAPRAAADDDGAPANDKIARPMSSSNLAPSSSAAAAAKPRPPCAISRTASLPKKPAMRPGAPVSLPRAAGSVHPARRLACGTAVYVRTRYVNITDRCCLVIWLPARVVTSSDAYHCTVKYAADLHDMFAGRVVRVPVGHIRPAPAPNRATAAAAAATDQRRKPEPAPHEDGPHW